MRKASLEFLRLWQRVLHQPKEVAVAAGDQVGAGRDREIDIVGIIPVEWVYVEFRDHGDMFSERSKVGDKCFHPFRRQFEAGGKFGWQFAYFLKDVVAPN